VVELNSLHGEIYDSVNFYNLQWYVYNVVDAEKPLSIKMEVYSGDPDIYVNPIKIPDNMINSVFNSKDHFNNEELVIEAE
jgi:hypothetical protein